MVTGRRYGPAMLRALAEVVFPATCPGLWRAGRAAVRGVRRATMPARAAVPPPAGLDALHVPFAYTGVVRELVARAKYRHRHAALAWLATRDDRRRSARRAGRRRHLGADDRGPAPGTAGFDQAELLATCRRRDCARPRRVRRCLRRVGDGPPDRARSRAERDRRARVRGPRDGRDRRRPGARGRRRRHDGGHARAPRRRALRWRGCRSPSSGLAAARRP